MSRQEAVLHDKRLMERQIKRGLLTREDVDATLDKLPDSASKADTLPPGEAGGSGERKPG